MRRLLGLSLLLFPATAAQAIVAVTAHSGAALSVFEKDKSASLKGTGYTLGSSILWQPGKGETLSPFALGFLARQTKINYLENAIHKRGTYISFGPEIGFTKAFSDSLGIQLLLDYSIAPTLTTVSSNTVLLNNETFHYSTWESYKGSGAAGARLVFVHDKVTGQFSKKNRFRSGLSLSYSTQTFSHAETDVTSSKEALAPSVTSTAEDVRSRFTLITAELFLGLTF